MELTELIRKDNVIILLMTSHYNMRPVVAYLNESPKSILVGMSKGPRMNRKICYYSCKSQGKTVGLIKAKMVGESIRRQRTA